MSCCGQKRNEETIAFNQPAKTYTSALINKTEKQPDIMMEYTGQKGLTAKGPFTGIMYRWNVNGDRIPVDHRDAGALKAVPNLKKVNG
jgi:hypothetical protein